MQDVSKAYKESMKKPLRGRGYIKAYIGVINSDAQGAASAEASENAFTYFSDSLKPFTGEVVDKPYATGEQDFTHVDGTMYFLPEQGEEIPYYNGLVTEELSGTICISFGDRTGLDIKGLTIDFGECYPVDFMVENDSGIKSYTGNTQALWRTEDVFWGTSFFRITPSRMVNGMGRLRIGRFVCGIANTFSNKEVKSYSFKDFVSPISEDLPGQDMTLVVENNGLYYSADNPESALAFMEMGQEIQVSFGYEPEEETIEWLPANTAYLKSWTADDTQAKFTATDRFDNMSGTYRRGVFRPHGISLYDLAVDVLQDAGITDEREFFIDPYLRQVMVYNPVPVVSHADALKLIANAGRCVLYQDRKCRIHMQSSFIPDMTAVALDRTLYSSLKNILKDTPKEAYAMGSRDFSRTDGSVRFIPESGGEYLENGYVSRSIADEDGSFTVSPVVVIMLEAGFTCYGLCIRFRNVAPESFTVKTWYEGEPVGEYTVQKPDLVYVTNERFSLFDRMDIVFTRGASHTRITIDSILLGDVTDYLLTYDYDLQGTPAGTRQGKIKAINVRRSIYRESDERKELLSEEVVISPEEPEHTVYFNNASYGLEVEIEDSSSIACEITEYSSFQVKLLFSGMPEETMIRYSIKGYEYVVDTVFLSKQHNPNGEIVEWKNPLISTAEQARDLEEWLASYFLGDVDYKISCRGDPRTDANDLFYLELKNRETPLLRMYQNELKFSGAWSGSMKGRKAVLRR